MEEQILETLDILSSQHGISILGAWESGSRAWGISNAESDYDVRFIYCGKPSDYLSFDPWPATIERMSDPIDAVGWDIRKVLKLALLKGNVQPLEWIATCPSYLRASKGCALLEAALERLWEPSRAAWHYHGIAVGHYHKATNPSLRISKRLKALVYAQRALYCRRLSGVPTSFNASRVLAGTGLEPVLEAYRSGLCPYEDVWDEAIRRVAQEMLITPAPSVRFTEGERAQRVTIADEVFERIVWGT
jgi:predicted nucleotidyltransferase